MLDIYAPTVPEWEMKLWKSRHGTHRKLMDPRNVVPRISIFGIYVSYVNVSKIHMLKCIFHVHKCEFVYIRELGGKKREGSV